MNSQNYSRLEFDDSGEDFQLLLQEGQTSFKAKRLPYYATTLNRLGCCILALIIVFITFSTFLPKPLPEPSPHWKLEQSWAQYSPYFPAEPYIGPPQSCVVNQVSILQRHGARLPTLAPSLNIAAAIAKLHAVASEINDPRLAFLEDYRYNIDRYGQPGALVNLGAREAFDSAGVQFQRYSHLVSEEMLPFVRAPDSDRVVKSATNWTAGFAAASKNKYQPSLSVIIPEELNNTLVDHMCPLANSSSAQTDEWLSVYAPPITARLNKAAPGSNLDDGDVYALMSQCAFDTITRYYASGNPGVSPFCALFSDEEFRDYEYQGDLDKFYGRGPGQPLGRVQGVGYTNELLARLTSTPVSDHTQTNRTLDSDPATFPLDRNIYVDFSHDNTMVAMYGAIGVGPWQEGDGMLSTKVRPKWKENREKAHWVTAKLVPFSARMVVERMTCYQDKQFVRILINDAVESLSFCRNNKPGRWREGLCTLKDFVESQSYARNNGDGDFEKCFD